ncbi:MAG: polysaccharide deacetylase family protein [Nitrospirota bacterium]|nr:polysaccharide deacetylase family protein [Nitrospirota bacterium]
MHITRRDFLKFSGAGIAFLSLPQNLWAKTTSIPVLMYHDISSQFVDDYTVSPSLFSAQMEWLHSMGYHTLFFSEAESFIEKNNDRAVIITFDDGYASILDYAFPLLKEYGFKATVNIIGKHTGAFIKLGGNRPLLSWDEYRYLGDSGLIDLGCHTHNLHSRRLAADFSESLLEEDLKGFQEILKQETGKRTEILAWPYGIYTGKSIAIAEKAGFRYILTSNEGYLRKESSLLEIPRLNINDKLDLISFQQYLGESS